MRTRPPRAVDAPRGAAEAFTKAMQKAHETAVPTRVALERFSSKAFAAMHPTTWTVAERTVQFPEGAYPQTVFTGPVEPYEIGVTEKGIGPSFAAPPEVTVTFGPLLAKDLTTFSSATYHELRPLKPSKPVATTLDGKEAFELFCEFSIPQEGAAPARLARRILHVDVHGRLVVITYTAHATQLLRFKKEASAIIDSLRFK